MTKQPKYLNQWGRIQRWYQRFGEISDGKLHDRSTDFYQDEVYSFLMNCYHLKDWIKNDSADPSLTRRVESFITDSRDMS